MIQLDMIKWIARVLRNEGDSLSDYSIEYATALLMNLSLRAAGKDKCEDPNIELLKVLNDLVEHDNLQVRTYVNGTLYSIFTRRKLREEAKELGMPEVLQYLMQNSDEQFKRQIQYILDQLNMQADSNDGQQQQEEDFDDEEDDDDDDDEEDDEDIVEEEEGEFNDIIDEQGILVGEDLLVNDFVGTKEEGNQHIRTVQMLMERDR
jgi:LisH domain-containing protein ARMC9